MFSIIYKIFRARDFSKSLRLTRDNGGELLGILVCFGSVGSERGEVAHQKRML